MRFSAKFVRMSVILSVVLLFVVAGISSGNQMTSLAQGSTPAATSQTFAPCPANSGTGGANATMSATSAGGASGSGTGGLSATMSSTDTGSPSETMSASNASGASATMSATTSAGGTTGTAYIGIEVTDVENCGVQVLSVMPGSPAEMAKLQVGDVIVAVNGQAISSLSTSGGMSGSTSSSSATATMESTMSATSSAGGAAGSTGPSTISGMTASLASFVQQHQPGDMITLTVERAGQQMDVQVTLAANPSSTGGSSSSGSSSSGSATMEASPASTPGQ